MNHENYYRENTVTGWIKHIWLVILSMTKK
jgi:hypothetical protein